MTISGGLVLFRFVHYAGLLTLFGASLFPLYAYSRKDRGRTGSDRTLLFGAALLSLAGCAGWFVFAVATMTDSMKMALDRETLGSVIMETHFGAMWSMHLAMAAILAVITTITFQARGKLRRPWIIATLSGLTLASLAGTGHTEAQEGADFILHAGADSIHLLAAGAWLGGLVPLFSLVSRCLLYTSPSPRD